MKRSLINTINNVFKKIYSTLENSFGVGYNRKFKKNKIKGNIFKLNNIMNKVYKRPELNIVDWQNVKEFEYETSDFKKISGVLYEPNPNSKKYVVALHWFAGNKFWGLYHARVFAEMGYNIISIDFRNHGSSDRDTCTLGIKEVRDLESLMPWIEENTKCNHLAIMGTSMGGFVSQFFSIKHAELAKKMNLKFVVSDVPFASMTNLFLHTRNKRLPFISSYSFMKKMDKIFKKLNKVEANNNINFDDADIIKLFDKGYKPLSPSLFLHSLDDKVTPPTDTYSILLERSKYIKGDELKMFKSSMHTQGLRIHFKSFTKAIATFISKQDNNKKDLNTLIKKWDLNTEENKKDKKDFILE